MASYEAILFCATNIKLSLAEKCQLARPESSNLLGMFLLVVSQLLAGYTHNGASYLSSKSQNVSAQWLERGALIHYHIQGGLCPVDKRLFNTI